MSLFKIGQMSKAIDNPYASLTDELVESALKEEFGEKATLDSYTVVEFAKKGDNFASHVTSIEVGSRIVI